MIRYLLHLGFAVLLQAYFEKSLFLFLSYRTSKANEVEFKIHVNITLLFKINV